MPEILGINAFAVGMGISSIVTSVLNILMLKRKVKVKLKILKPVIIFSLITIPCSALTAFTGSLLSFVLPDFFVILLSCVIGAVFFVLLSMIAGVLDINYVNMIKTRFKPRKKNKLLSNDV